MLSSANLRFFQGKRKGALGICKKEVMSRKKFGNYWSKLRILLPFMNQNNNLLTCSILL